MLSLSYWQTITAYPSSGGSYVVARKNIATGAGLLAAAALMVDYMLNVAVSISAGIGALTSAVPPLQPWTLTLCLAVLGVVALVNLRGTRESGIAFALPTYLFIATLCTVLAIGSWRAWGGQPAPMLAPPPIGPASTTLTMWLLPRAFAADCTAVTGMEAESIREKQVVSRRRWRTGCGVVIAEARCFG